MLTCDVGANEIDVTSSGAGGAVGRLGDGGEVFQVDDHPVVTFKN